uniref:Uncharacterized protein n=1 Tax=Suberites domuncula TaxID=55567 RepID=B1GT47_SUBDO|nr:hypothetical protein [Suberites domuncula]
MGKLRWDLVNETTQGPEFGGSQALSRVRFGCLTKLLVSEGEPTH